MPAREFELGPATRDAYGDALCELGAEDPRIVALDADLSKSTKSGVFGKKFPDRYWNIGIQEANLVGMACGLASTGSRTRRTSMCPRHASSGPAVCSWC